MIPPKYFRPAADTSTGSTAITPAKPWTPPEPIDALMTVLPNSGAIQTSEKALLLNNYNTFTLPFPTSTIGTAPLIYLGFIAVDGGAAAVFHHQVPVSPTAKVILSAYVSVIARNPDLLDGLVHALAGAQGAPLPSSQSGGVPPHHAPFLRPSPLVYGKLSPQSKPRTIWLPPETPSIADCLTRRHDWSDLYLQCDLAINVSGYMTPERRDLLTTALEKVKGLVGSSFTDYWARQAAWSRYGSLASIVSCSNYARSEDFIHCGHGGFSCQDRLLCPRCAYNFMARRVAEEFGHAFGEDCEVYYILLSLSRDADETHRLKLRDADDEVFHSLKHRVGEQPHIITGSAGDYGIGFDGGDDLLQCRLIWHFFMEAVHEFTGDGRGSLFSGVVGGPELAVQLNPLRALPHANYICWSPGFTIDGVRELRRFIRTKMRDCRLLESGLYPAIACYRLATADDLRRVISYIFKPVDLASAYIRAAGLAGYAPVALQALNTDVNRFLENALQVFWNLRRVSKYGRCHASHHDYIGSVSTYRLAQRELAAERRMGGRVKHGGSMLHPIDRWLLHQQELSERPHWPRQSRFHRWKAWHDQSQPLSARARRAS
jgi:hypothetical protein